MTAEPVARPTPTLSRTRQLEMYRRAIETLPGGTDSNFRAWGEDTIYVDRGKGGRVWDIDGNEYIDLRMGYGPVVLGHADDRVDDYVNERMRRGVSFSLTSEDEVRRAGAPQGAQPLGQEGADDGLRAPRRRCTRCASPGPTPAAPRS